MEYNIMITQINKFKKINESHSNSYSRVIPRDFFNEAKLLKCMGVLSLKILDKQLPKNINITIEHNENGEAFNITQNEYIGIIYVSNYEIIINDEYITTGTIINSKDNFPMICYVDDVEYIMFDENGEFSNEFIEFFSNEENNEIDDN